MKKKWIGIAIGCLIGFLSITMEKDSFFDKSGESIDSKGNMSLSHDEGVVVRTFDSNRKETDMVFHRVPQRVVTDEFNPLETVLALGKGETIVCAALRPGSEYYQKLLQRYPQELAKLGTLHNHSPDLETVLVSEPDFILGWKGTFSPKQYRATSWWNKRGVNTYIVSTANHILSNGTIEDECHFLEDMGKIFDVTDKTDRMIQEIHQELSMVKEKTKGRKKQNVAVIELTGRTIMNYDKGWIVGDMVQQLGGDMPIKSSRISYEELIWENPDVIFVNYFREEEKISIDRFFKRPEFQSMKAVRNGRIYAFPFEFLYTPGVKTVNGIRVVRDGLYPDLATPSIGN